MKKLQLGLTFFAAVLMLSACTKENDKPDVDFDTLSEDAALMESISSDMFNVVDDETKNGDYNGDVGKTGATGGTSSADTCATITFDNNGGAWPKTLTIDFGSGCTNTSTGVERSGKLILEYSGLYSDPGSVVSITTDNYFVNGNQVDGIKTITNDGRNTAGNLQFTVRDIGLEITKPDGGVVTWDSERVNEWAEGEGTNFWTDGIAGVCDDTYLITGSAEGALSDGTDYRLDIVDPLRKEICCYWVNDGSIKYTVDSYELATIDYGDGTCDATAEFTYDGEVHVIFIP